MIIKPTFIQLTLFSCGQPIFLNATHIISLEPRPSPDFGTWVTTTHAIGQDIGNYFHVQEDPDEVLGNICAVGDDGTLEAILAAGLLANSSYDDDMQGLAKHAVAQANHLRAALHL